jgi:hypothetical protein
MQYLILLSALLSLVAAVLAQDIETAVDDDDAVSPQGLEQVSYMASSGADSDAEMDESVGTQLAM